MIWKKNCYTLFKKKTTYIFTLLNLTCDCSAVISTVVCLGERFLKICPCLFLQTDIGKLAGNNEEKKNILKISFLLGKDDFYLGCTEIMSKDLSMCVSLCFQLKFLHHWWGHWAIWYQQSQPMANIPQEQHSIRN